MGPAARTARAYLAIDLGTSAVKAAFIGPDGRPIGGGTVEYGLLMLPAGMVECEAETYWDAIVRAVGAARAAAEQSIERIETTAVALTCQAETLLRLDSDGVPLGRAIVWLDNRSTAEAAELGERLGVRTIYASTGQMRSMPTSPASKILWLARHEPVEFRRASTICLIGDWVMARFTGVLAADLTTYSTSLLLDLDVHDWWPPMLDVLDLDPRLLPRLVPPGSVVGSLLPAVAAQLGLPARVPVVTGAMDTVAGAVGAANLSPGGVTEATGTYLAPLTCFDAMPAFRDPGFPVILHAVRGLFCAVPYGQTAGAVLRWLHDVVRPAAASEAERDYEALITEAEQVPPGSDGVTFLPHLAGAGYPDWDVGAAGAIAGIRLGHGRGQIARAALEAVAFMLRDSIEGLRDAGAKIDLVTSVGPASRSLGWMQMKADVCQLPVARLEFGQASLLGAAMLAAVATGDRADLLDATTAMTRVADVVEPNPAVNDAYSEAFARYRLLYRSLRPFDSAARPRSV